MDKQNKINDIWKNWNTQSIQLMDLYGNFTTVEVPAFNPGLLFINNSQ